jgi:hypothetical protein
VFDVCQVPSSFRFCTVPTLFDYVDRHDDQTPAA